MFTKTPTVKLLPSQLIKTFCTQWFFFPLTLESFIFVHLLMVLICGWIWIIYFKKAQLLNISHYLEIHCITCTLRSSQDDKASSEQFSPSLFSSDYGWCCPRKHGGTSIMAAWGTLVYLSKPCNHTVIWVNILTCSLLTSQKSSSVADDLLESGSLNGCI